MKIRYSTEVVVIGAGPAGLSTASSLNNKSLSFYIIDCGKLICNRIHFEKNDLNKGIGGSGLFSDGKFSFFPSGSNLYRLKDELLRESYSWFKGLISTIGITLPDYPSNIYFESIDIKNNKKIYESFYRTLNERKYLIKNMISGFHEKIFSETDVIRLDKNKDGYIVFCKNKDKGIFSIKANYIVVATGKIGTTERFLTEFSRKYTQLLDKKRFEFGVRIDTISNVSFFNKNVDLDIKYVWKKPENVEYRTFCTCRNGEIWHIPYEDITTISGRADTKIGDFSNFAFLVRYSGNSFERGLSIWNRIKPFAEKGKVFFEKISNFMELSNLPSNFSTIEIENRNWYPKNDFSLGSIKAVSGEDFFHDIKTGLNKLLDQFPDLSNEKSYCLFPVIEGVGFYPKIDHELHVLGENIWFAGDIVGDFRGLVPAFISGFLAGLSVHAHITNKRI